MGPDICLGSNTLFFHFMLDAFISGSKSLFCILCILELLSPRSCRFLSILVFLSTFREINIAYERVGFFHLFLDFTIFQPSPLLCWLLAVPLSLTFLYFFLNCITLLPPFLSNCSLFLLRSLERSILAAYCLFFPRFKSSLALLNLAFISRIYSFIVC